MQRLSDDQRDEHFKEVSINEESPLKSAAVVPDEASSADGEHPPSREDATVVDRTTDLTGRLTSGQATGSAMGETTDGRLYGYVLRGDGSLAPDPDLAEVIDRVYREYAGTTLEP